MRTIIVFQGANGDWYWHAKRKGRIVETGAEGYASRRNCLRAVAAKLRARYSLAP